ncbi:MAG: alcohol dehydrogenase catalytic domain-containing protein [Absicoccus sp.]|uniref:zinc-dependent alcohol dehydrogenase n=1 Tax=Absicoccus sp. TaxID=2718527 RepID=UPI002A75F52B|nr:zinc-binding dehydrogenase [Absicoccus sp.]MDY3036302.1 alcohol dehydrogenase catalytic domain-containing protein [Absicoccus sp.]
MKAANYHGKQAIEIQQIPTPKVGPKEVLIRNLRSSICGTDVAVYQHGPDGSHRITVGQEFGHETVSEIVAVGHEIQEQFHVGQRVYPYPRLARNDPSRAGTLGAFSEYILIPQPKWNQSLYAVPEAISNEEACMIEPFSVGTRAARRAQPQAGQTAIVFGAGTIGLAAAIALQYFGLKKVMVVDLSKKRLEIARSLGFPVTTFQDMPKQALAYFGQTSSQRANVDIWIDAAGDEAVWTCFMQQGKIESRFVEVAVGPRYRNVDFLALSFAQKSLIGSGGYMPEDVEDVLAMMASHRWPIKNLISHTYRLDDLEQALQMASDPASSLNVQIVLE